MAGSARSSCTALARLRNPSSIPSKAWKKATASCTISAPATLAIVRSRAWVATPTARSDIRVGTSRARKSRFSRNRVSRRGASSRSSALRVGRRVDDHHVELLGVDQLVELLHGHVLLRARERAGEILVEPVGQDGLGLLRSCGRSARRGRRTCPSSRASGRAGARASRPAPPTACWAATARPARRPAAGPGRR